MDELDPVHNQSLHLSLAAFPSSLVESLYVQAHELHKICVEKSQLLYSLKIKANPAYDAVFHTKHLILYTDKETATDSVEIHCKTLLKETKILLKLLSTVFLMFPPGILSYC